jgi:hypothetical protein
MEVCEPPPIDSPDIDQGSLVEIRKGLGKGPPSKYDEITSGFFNATSSSETRVQLKQEFSKQLRAFEDGWERTRYWLKQRFNTMAIASHISGISENGTPD